MSFLFTLILSLLCLIALLWVGVVITGVLERGKHKTRTLVYREHWNVEEGWEEER